MKKKYEYVPELVCEDGVCKIPSVGEKSTKKALTDVWVRDKEGNELYVLPTGMEVTILEYDGDRAVIEKGKYVKAEFLG